MKVVCCVGCNKPLCGVEESIPAKLVVRCQRVDCNARQRILVLNDAVSVKALPDKDETLPDYKSMSYPALKQYVEALALDTERLHQSELERLTSLRSMLARKKEKHDKEQARGLAVASASKAVKPQDGAVGIAIQLLQAMLEDGEVDATTASIAINKSRSGDNSELAKLTGMRLS